MLNFKKLIVPVLSLSLLVPGMAGAEEQKPTVDTPAAGLRASLDHLLSEHFVLAVTSMTKSFDGDEDAEAAMKALNQNAADMKPAIAGIYGDDGAAKFDEIFSAHNSATDEFAKAVKDGDTEGEKAAQQKVEDFISTFSGFLGQATEGKLPEAAANEALAVHEKQVMETFKFYVDGDYEKAYMTFREGYKHMYVVSKALSNAIVTQMPDKFENTKVDTSAADLRSTLNSLTAEHFALAVMGMQKEYNAADDFDFVSWAENENTADFSAAVGSIYGEDAGNQFEKIWQTDHIAAQSDLVSAVKKEDQSAKENAEKRLGRFSNEFGSFLGAATEENLPTKDAQGVVQIHENQVLKTFDNYVKKDYSESLASFREGYAFTFEIGKGLSNAIVTQMPDKFASGMPDMPKTGMGGASKSSNSGILLWISFSSLFAAAAVYGIRRKAAMK
ncbi:copper amine oxidase [Peribacillus sp. FSL H8-0477]|uniref:copper amine oxidase n=1 Tax=Peribacillus sp. FSL H8-0477 TaxID=2921388 RepID=UPI0030F73EF2